MNALEINNLTKHYNGFSIDKMNLTLPSGSIMGLIGENAAGKSTTIKLILDMIDRDEGTITVLGKDNKDNFRLTKNDIGVVLDEVSFSGFYKPKHIDKVMRVLYENWDSGYFFSLINQFHIPCDKKFKELSRGNKMKLGIAVALSHKPKLLIFDEATNGLDPVVRDEVTDMIFEFTRDEEHSVLISSHIVTDLEKICDYIAFMKEGNIILCEEKDKLREDYAIIQCDKDLIKSIDSSALVRVKHTPYGDKAIVKKMHIPQGVHYTPVTIEELFVFMIRGDEN